MGADKAERFDNLTERHRECLRLVYQLRKSAEIAVILGVSTGHINNLLIEAKEIIGVTSRFEAARQFAAYETGVDSLHPVENTSSQPPLSPLPSVLPTSKAPNNLLTLKHVVAWVWIIAIATPVGMTVAVMAVVALEFMLGIKSS